MQSNITSLITKFINREISAEELESLRLSIKKNEVSEESLSSFYQQAWSEAGMSHSEIDPEMEKRMWENLKKHIYSTRKIRRIKMWTRVAVVFFIAVLSSSLGYFAGSSHFTQANNLEVKVGIGEKAQVKLPDGSLIWLNSASQLTYSPNYGKKNRTVALSGEGYFDVKSNQNIPFIVELPDKMKLKVLGTKFNIKNYPEDTQAESFLLEGKIEIVGNGMREELKPNEKLVFNKANTSFSITKTNNSEDALSWMQNWLVLDKQTLENIANILKRKYKVDVVFQSEHIKQILYTGKVKSDKLEDILDLISSVSPIICTMQGTTIIFSE